MLITFVHSDLLELFFPFHILYTVPNKNFRISTFYELFDFLIIIVIIGVSLSSFLALDLCLLGWLYSITTFEAH